MGKVYLAISIIIVMVFLFALLVLKDNLIHNHVKNITILVLLSLIFISASYRENYVGSCYPGYKKASAYNSYSSINKGWCLNSAANVSNESSDVGIYDSEGRQCQNSRQLSPFESINIDTKGWCDVPHEN